MGPVDWSRPNLRRAVGVAVGALFATGVAASAVVAPAPPAEAGRGRPVPAVAAAPAPPPPVTTAPVATVPAPTLIGTLSAATSYSSTPGGPPSGQLPALNPFGAAEVVAVIGRPDAGWLHVELPIRPNGSTGWIPATGVELTQTAYRVSVSLAARVLTVTDGGRAVFTTPVAVGKPSTPTPPDETYLWELIRPDDPSGAYGPYIFGLAEYSDAYTVFNGGDAQIGIHGQDEPWSIGLAASNGCVRLPNTAITQLAAILPLGTPVSIS
jgi:lipoprotein-anchoring transpeptidase ErfK/SrfK